MVALESVLKIMEVMFPMILLVLTIGGLIVGGSLILGKNLNKRAKDGEGGVYIRDPDKTYEPLPGGAYREVEKKGDEEKRMG